MTVRVPFTRATTAEWGSVYPWHFDAALPSTGPVLGVDRLGGDCPFGLDPFGLVEAGLASNPNVVISGSPGGGKSSLVKQMLWFGVGAFGYRFVATDVKGEYAALSSALGVPTMELYPGGPTRVNPLVDPHNRLEFVRALGALCVERSLDPAESAVLTAAVRVLPDRPAMSDLFAVLRDPPERVLTEVVMDKGSVLAATQALRFGLGELLAGSLAGMFDGDANTAPPAAPRGFVVNLARCGTDDRVLRFALLAGQRAVDQMVTAETRRTLVVNDEAWRLAGTTETVRWMQHSFKLGRQQAKANIIVVHRFSELSAQTDGVTAQIASRLVSDADTRIMFRLGDVADARDTVDRLGLPPSTVEALTQLPAHRCLIDVRGRIAVLDVRLSPAMLEISDTNAAMRETPKNGV